MELLLGVGTAAAAALIAAAVVAGVRMAWNRVHSRGTVPHPGEVGTAQVPLESLREELSTLRLKRATMLLQITELQSGAEAIERQIGFIEDEMRRLADGQGAP